MKKKRSSKPDTAAFPRGLHTLLLDNHGKASTSPSSKHNSSINH